MSNIYFHLYVTAIGFVTAGLLSSFVQLVTGRPVGFSLTGQNSSLSSLIIVLTRVIAGPVILMSNAIKGARFEGRPPYWLALSTLISTIWSFFSGVVVLQALINISQSI